MTRIGNQPPVGGTPSGDPSRNNHVGKFNGRRVSISHEQLGLSTNVSSVSGQGSLKGRAKPQDPAPFASGTNFAQAHMFKGV